MHRDLKPANILLSQAGDPKVADFGLAHASDPSLAVDSFGAGAGTPHYMAPEQASKTVGQIGPATDVFALGAVLYAALRGQSPFAASTAAESMHRVQFEEPSPLRPHGIPKDLESICLRCLVKEPRGRYQTAAQLAQDLHRFLAHQPVSARRSGAAAQLRLWVRRRPNLAVLSGICAVSLVLLIGGLGWHVTQIREKNRRLVSFAAELRQQNRETSALHAALEKQVDELDRSNRELSHANLRLEKAAELMLAISRSESDSQRQLELKLLTARYLAHEPDPEIRTLGAFFAVNAGQQHARQGNRESVQACFDQANLTFQSLTEEFPENPRHWSNRANTHARAALALKRVHERRAAVEQTEREVAVREEQLKRFPDPTGRRRYRVASAWIDLNRELIAVRRYEDASRAVRRAQAHLEALITEQPDQSQFQARLAELSEIHGQRPQPHSER